jgi:hypothetical protein
MKSLQEATERICELKGNLVALDTLLTALLQCLPTEERAKLPSAFEDNAELARTVLIHSPISEHTLAAFERDVKRTSALIALVSA